MMKYDSVSPKGIKGKIILTCFPGREGKKIDFNEKVLIKDLSNFNKLNCTTIISLVEDNEFTKLCDKKIFVRHVYSNNLKWIHLPIVDLKAPDSEFIYKWQASKILLKNDLNIEKKLVYPDHYEFTETEIIKITKEAYMNNYEIIMTEKDYFRIKKFKNDKIKYLKVSLEIFEKEKLLKEISKSYVQNN